MAIDYRKLRSLTARELIAALDRDGFTFVRQVGSHRRYYHVDGRRVTVAPHGSGDTFSVKTLKTIIEVQACWSESDHFSSVDEVLATALANLPYDRRFDRENRREAVRRMIEVGDRRNLSLGEPVTRQFLHEGHRR